MRSLILVAAMAALSIFFVPTASAAARPLPPCVEKIFYTYIQDPGPWTPLDCTAVDEQIDDTWCRVQMQVGDATRPQDDPMPMYCVRLPRRFEG